MIKLNLQFFGGRGSAAGKRAGQSSGERDVKDYFTDKKSTATEGKDQDTIQLKGKDTSNTALKTMLENSGWVQESSIKDTWVYPKTEAGRTMLPRKSTEQISSETQQLQELPSGSHITRIVDGKPVEYIAHDQARIGRNGRYLRKRVFSVPTDEKYRNGMNKLVKNTVDPYYVAQGQWKLKK